jgi:hypothetical protein
MGHDKEVEKPEGRKYKFLWHYMCIHKCLRQQTLGYLSEPGAQQGKKDA